ncbi:hypothetical protein [Amycolatopsis tolypomycina]|uniref:Isochorismatase family protein n=1 Tax=Amycolatopsis tolypomycina TaxID=208445 RepID=A0A1H5CEU8_9PSEU|nr:hypothetical protein [Amycolatopsis tolypomycina]SED65117.1 hypothetical protein SAMN04489727_8742 [Amycolatopsis tolypomycina]
MSEIDPATTALVLVDLQERIVVLPTTPYRGESTLRAAADHGYDTTEEALAALA